MTGNTDVNRVFFRAQEVADRWQMSVRTLEGWRDQGIGPTYHKIGGSVRYSLDDVEKFEKQWRLHGDVT